MKKILVLSLFLLTLSFISCTADPLPGSENQKLSMTDEIGPQDAQIPLPPPKP